MQDNEILLKLIIRSYAFLRRSPAKAGKNVAAKSFGTILDILAEQDGLSQAQLTAIAEIRQQSSSKILATLEKQGYITRVPSEKNKRVSYIHLTEAGREAQKELQRQRRLKADAFFSCLSEDENEALYRILNKLLEKA